MSTTMVASEVKAVPPVISSIQDIPLGKIRESKTNPRRFFDETKLAELADFVPGNKIRVMLRIRFCAPGVEISIGVQMCPVRVVDYFAIIQRTRS